MSQDSITPVAQALDVATRAWLESAGSVIAQYSGDIQADWRKLLHAVNAQRRAGGLPALPPLEWWPTHDWEGRLIDWGTPEGGADTPAPPSPPRRSLA